eukprot:15446377-Alexandrium_andersonii.AAC.1
MLDTLEWHHPALLGAPPLGWRSCPPKASATPCRGHRTRACRGTPTNAAQLRSSERAAHAVVA